MSARLGFAPTPHVPVGVLGGTSVVGRFLIPRLVRRGHAVVACSRTAQPSPAAPAAGAVWIRAGATLPAGLDRVPVWISLCPLWATVELLDWLDSAGVEQLAAVSSTSLVTKQRSGDPAERQLAARLARAEEAVFEWAERRGVIATVLRPTMIYDGRSDNNVSAIAAWVRRCGWFPLCGSAEGLRQPVHADDVATACVTSAFHPEPRHIYTLSGSERLTFRDLVERTCCSHGLAPRTVRLPAWAWRLLFATARGLGLASAASAAIGARMNEDLVFDHADAAADLGFRPRPFVPDGDPMAATPGHQPSCSADRGLPR